VSGRFVVCALVLVFAVVQSSGGQQPSLSGPPAASAVNSPEPLARAQRLMADGQFKEGEAVLRSYLLTDARSGQARYMLAYGLLRQNRPKESLEEYTRAAGVQAPSAEDLKNVAQAYVLLSDYTDADRWMSRALEMDRSDAEIWYSLGRLRYSEQKFGEAAQCFEQTLKLAPKNVKAEYNLGLAFEGLNRTDDAVIAYRQAIAWQEAGPPEKVSEQPLLDLAIVLLHQGKLDEAQSLLLRAVAIAPADVRIREQLGQLYMQEGNFAEGGKHLEIATRLDPGKSNLHFLLGQAYRHLGRQQDAKAQFDAAARLADAPAASRVK
jgi:tetratricopeptide (TPR) repeat protein